MTVIEYRRHFLGLLPAIIVTLPALLTLGDKLPTGNARDLFLLGIGGTLHALAVVVSLRKGVAALGRGLLFLVLATVACMVVPFVGAFAVALIPYPPSGDWKMLFALFAGSASGAASYWLLVRGFWVRSLPGWSLILTMVLCGTATVVSFQIAGRTAWSSTLPPALSHFTRSYLSDSIPTIAWWVAFSLALYIGED